MKRKHFFICLYMVFSCVLAGAQTDTSILKNHLVYLTKIITNRNSANVEELNKAAGYIKNRFQLYSDSVTEQVYTAGWNQYKNIICSFGTENKERVIIGAHYDVCMNQPGADDNASGVAGILELARQLEGKKLKVRIDLVAYTLEEPPYFRTESMGSYIHAKWLYDNKIPVLGMISVEMIGYFSDERNSQGFPYKFMKAVYGNTGDFILLVRNLNSGRFARKFIHTYKKSKTILTKKFSGSPKKFEGVDFSDHLNYWKFGFSAFMITDTSYYRNPNYHQKTDTLETLDLFRMAKVVDGILLSILSLYG